MSRVKFDEMDKYTAKSSGNWFSLKDDGDVARVRFLFDSLDDLPIRVHDIQIGESYRTVACLRDYDDPVHKCPLCESGNNPRVKLYIPLYDEDDQLVKFWQRPQSFGTKIASQFSRYKNFPSHLFEIERHGKAGDRQTTYELFEVDSDDKSLADFEVPDAIGTVVMDKTSDDMDYYLEHEEFPDSVSSSTSARRESSVREERSAYPRRGERRTPAKDTDRF